LYDIEVEGSHEYLIDGVISHNTINAPNNATIDNVDRAFMQAFDMGCKGVTYYRDGSRQFQSLATVKHKKKRKNGEKYELPEVMNSRRINMTTLKGKASLFIVLDDRNIPVEFYVNPPIESPETAAIMTAICRLIAVGVQGYEDLDEYLDQLKKANKMYENKNQILTYIIKALQGAKRRKNNYNINVIKDLPLEEEDMVEVMAIYNIINLAQTGKDDLNDYISVLKYTNKEHGNVSSVLSFLIKAFNKFTEVLNAEEGKVVVTKENCPDCGHKMILKEGCDTCPNCSYSKCG
jgi:ribonucleotide reductase alpha subunit